MLHPVQVQGRSPSEIKASEEKKRKEEEDKKIKKIAAPKQKQYYDVRLEVTVPAVITYRVYAEDESDALVQINKKTPSGVKPNISQKRNIKATVFQTGSSIIRLIKRF